MSRPELPILPFPRIQINVVCFFYLPTKNQRKNIILQNDTYRWSSFFFCHDWCLFVVLLVTTYLPCSKNQYAYCTVDAMMTMDGQSGGGVLLFLFVFMLFCAGIASMECLSWSFFTDPLMTKILGARCVCFSTHQCIANSFDQWWRQHVQYAIPTPPLPQLLFSPSTTHDAKTSEQRCCCSMGFHCFGSLEDHMVYDNHSVPTYNGHLMENYCLEGGNFIPQKNTSDRLEKHFLMTRWFDLKSEICKDSRMIGGRVPGW